MADPGNPDTPSHATPAWRRPRLIAIFCIIAAMLIAADLALKWWAFQKFPAHPVDVAQTLDNARDAQQQHGGPLAAHVDLPRDSMQIAPRILRIRLVLNLGAVFGIGQGKTWLFVIITIAAVGIIGATFLTTDASHRFAQVLLAMILAGAGGNLYDRIVYGAVRDMLHLFPNVHLPFGWHWPDGNTELYPWVFNLADVYLTLGIALIVRAALQHLPDRFGDGAAEHRPVV